MQQYQCQGLLFYNGSIVVMACISERFMELCLNSTSTQHNFNFLRIIEWYFPTMTADITTESYSSMFGHYLWKPIPAPQKITQKIRHCKTLKIVIWYFRIIWFLSIFHVTQGPFTYRQQHKQIKICECVSKLFQDFRIIMRELAYNLSSSDITNEIWMRKNLILICFLAVMGFHTK